MALRMSNQNNAEGLRAGEIPSSRGGVAATSSKWREASSAGADGVVAHRKLFPRTTNSHRLLPRYAAQLLCVSLFLLLSFPTGLSAQPLTITTDTLPDTIIGTTYPSQPL